MTNAELAALIRDVINCTRHTSSEVLALERLADEVAARPDPKPLGPLAVLNDFTAKCRSIGLEPPVKMIFGKRGAEQLAGDLSSRWIDGATTLNPLSAKIFNIDVEQAPDSAPLRLWARLPKDGERSLQPDFMWGRYSDPQVGWVEIPTVRP